MLSIFFKWFEHSQVFQPSDHPAKPLPADAPSYREIILTTEDKLNLKAWHFVNPSISKDNRRVVLHAHGNAGDRGSRLGFYQVFDQVGLDCLAFDYRGYGGNPGRPSEEGLYRDMDAAYLWLVAQGYRPENILSFGESLGGGVASDLASRRKVGALILHSTYASIPKLAKELFPFLPVRLFGTIAFDTESKLPRIQCPVLILHSASDTLIKRSHADTNLAAANEPKVLEIIAGDHNEQPYARMDHYTAVLKDFVESLKETASSDL